MRRCCPTVLLLLAALAPKAATAADVRPERLLAKDSVAFLRFDGVQAHREGYDRTVFAKVVDEEFQPLLDAVAKMIYDAIGPQVLSERLLKGVRPAELIKLQKAAKQLPRFVELLKDHGFAIGVEVLSPTRPKFQITIVFPQGDARANASTVLGVFRLAAHLGQSKVQEVKLGTRTILQISDPSKVVMSCWKEGPNAVITIGTESPKQVVALAEGKRENITKNAMFRKVAGFKKYETWMRGFVDVGNVVAIVKKEIPPAAKILAALGVDKLGEISFHAGFQGRLQRSTVFVSLPKKREGLLRLLSSTGTFSPEKLPPLPPDTAMVAAGGFDLRALYDEGLRSVRMIALAVNPGAAEQIGRTLRTFERSLGEKIRRDVIGSLGSNYVVYASPTEGPLSLGTTVAVEVKDPKKLQQALQDVVRQASATFGVDISLRKRQYRGATLNVLQFGQRIPLAPTFAIYKGWLVISVYPQPVMGYVFRSQNGRRRWKPPALLQRALVETLEAGGGKSRRLAGISVSDPRPTIRQLLSLAPLFASFLSAIPGSTVPRFDLSLVPNSQAATEPLGESVTVSVDEGNGLRLESYASFPLPFQITGLDVYAYAVLIPYLAFAF